MFIAEGDEAMDDTFLLQEQIEEVAISTGAHFRLPVWTAPLKVDEIC
jgi:hypothetical protein